MSQKSINFQSTGKAGLYDRTYEGWVIADLDFQRVFDILQIIKKLIRSSDNVNLDEFLELAEQDLLKPVLEWF